MGFVLTLIQSRVTISFSVSVRQLLPFLLSLSASYSTPALHSLPPPQSLVPQSLLPASLALPCSRVHCKEVLHTTERAVPALSHPESEFLVPLPWPRSASLVSSIYILVHFVSSRFDGASFTPRNASLHLLWPGSLERVPAIRPPPLALSPQPSCLSTPASQLVLGVLFAPFCFTTGGAAPRSVNPSPSSRPLSAKRYRSLILYSHPRPIPRALGLSLDFPPLYHPPTSSPHPSPRWPDHSGALSALSLAFTSGSSLGPAPVSCFA